MVKKRRKVAALGVGPLEPQLCKECGKRWEMVPDDLQLKWCAWCVQSKVATPEGLKKMKLLADKQRGGKLA
jgi:hypothetical protein